MPFLVRHVTFSFRIWPVLLGEVHEDRARLHQVDPGLVVDDRRDLVVRADHQELRRELLVLPDVDRRHRVGNAQLLQHD